MDKPKYYNEARNKAAQKYISANLEIVSFRVRKGEKDAIKAEAARQGMSMAQFLTQAVNDKAGRQIVTPTTKEEG